MVRQRQVHSIALLDPMGDYGLGVFTHELAEGLASSGVNVDVYTTQGSVMPQLALPRHHRLLPVLGSILLRQRDTFRDASNPAQSEQKMAPVAQGPPRSHPRRHPLIQMLRNFLMTVELALYLRKMNYDLIWTQWPFMDGYGPRFWRFLRLLGLRVVHTVHDVLPHEPEEWASQKGICERIYKSAEALIVHSESSKRELCQLFPSEANKVVTSKLGLYSVFGRIPEIREEVRTSIGIEPDEMTLLFFGGTRPYKNLESIMKAMRNDYPRNVVLIVAGWDFGSLGGDPANRLARSRKMAEDLGITERVRFIPGPLDMEETARVFEAADVLVLPYLSSHGSALLLLGMTFQKYILATAVGGMDEYLAGYSRHKLLSGPNCEAVVDGITLAISAIECDRVVESPRIAELEWPRIAREILTSLGDS